jgi:hypothetical protein
MVETEIVGAVVGKLGMIGLSKASARPPFSAITIAQPSRQTFIDFMLLLLIQWFSK